VDNEGDESWMVLVAKKKAEGRGSGFKSNLRLAAFCNKGYLRSRGVGNWFPWWAARHRVFINWKGRVYVPAMLNLCCFFLSFFSFSSSARKSLSLAGPPDIDGLFSEGPKGGGPRSWEVAGRFSWDITGGFGSGREGGKNACSAGSGTGPWPGGPMGSRPKRFDCGSVVPRGQKYPSDYPPAWGLRTQS